MPSVFLCHSSLDKPFVRELASKLMSEGVRVWIDEAELNIGDSLIGKIGEAVTDVDYVAVVLSENSVSSKWVQRELNLALQREFATNRVVVLPLLLDHSELPPFLRDKVHADFRDPGKFDLGFSKLLRAIGQPASVPCAQLSRADPALYSLLNRGTKAWKKGDVIILKFEDFLELMLEVDDMELTDENLAFLCCASAHFGKFMNRMTKRAYDNAAAILAVATTAAQSSYQRVAWRAAGMLAHFDPTLTTDCTSGFKGEVGNRELFPGPILSGEVRTLLRSAIDDAATPPGLREKLMEAWRQMEGEFGAAF